MSSFYYSTADRIVGDERLTPSSAFGGGLDPVSFPVGTCLQGYVTIDSEEWAAGALRLRDGDGLGNGQTAGLVGWVDNTGRSGIWIDGDDPPEPPSAGTVPALTMVWLRVTRTGDSTYKVSTAATPGEATFVDGDEVTVTLEPTFAGPTFIDWPALGSWISISVDPIRIGASLPNPSDDPGHDGGVLGGKA